ncbi:GspH/FimT family pseudopilin [Catenovulum sp. 2E275]|uniref:GspH/FimT family pseudopilin n=1 Tax=Catenovulum sp. 2E275 TaxID=2980497 RepID=UPI0021D3513E|nr:GspH/FimT family pseudopilin [Catenovulum sp. 2E275]MCU4676276.1 GspH/FimT family pseudopilin [Catenovulum sp. 2E275]
MCRVCRMQGFSLLELIIASALIIVTLTFGIPSLHGALIQNRINNQIYNLSKDLLLARNHAIQYETQVVLCHLSSSNICDGEWGLGYSVFLDRNRDNVYQPNDDQLLLLRDYQNANDLIDFNGHDNIRYDFDGRLNSISGTFKFCPAIEDDEAYSRAIIISLSGRFRVSQDIDNDGKDELAGNNDHISCRS